MCKKTCEVCYPKKKAKMPWEGDISHTILSDGRKVLRGSVEQWEDMEKVCAQND